MLSGEDSGGGSVANAVAFVVVLSPRFSTAQHLSLMLPNTISETDSSIYQ